MDFVRRGALLLALLALAQRVAALDNGLSVKPPLGFNTWNYFGCNINETVVRAAADRLLSLGLVEAGYSYLNIDDCWQLPERSAEGRLQADPAKFPSGMAAIAADVHAKGLRFGIYSDAGSKTCAGFPGSRHHEEADAATFASWSVDFLKYDNCFASKEDIRERYTDMREALNKTGRLIYYSMCNWGVAQPWEWAQAVGNSWRTYEDIFPNWPSVLRSLDYGAAGLGQYAGPGGWNDPDMLEVGVADFSLAQQRSHFALWALVKSPLLIGANLEAIPEESLKILKAREVIAINQDDLGVAGDIIWKSGSTEIWAAPLAGNQRAVVLFNRHRSLRPKVIRVTWEQLGYGSGSGSSSGSGFKAAVRDLYAERDLGVFEGGFEAAVGSHDVAVLRVTPASGGSSSSSGAGADWRPWRDAAPAALQARMRAAALRARAWDARRAAIVKFVRAHALLLSAALAAALAACVAAAVALLRRRGAPPRPTKSQYEACPVSELSSRAGSDTLSSQGSPTKQLAALGAEV